MIEITDELVDEHIDDISYREDTNFTASGTFRDTNVRIHSGVFGSREEALVDLKDKIAELLDALLRINRGNSNRQ